MNCIRNSKIKTAKKAMIDIQFSWIFVVIAGALFLLLFVSLIGSQKKQADQVINAELLKKLDTLVTGSTSSFESFKEVDLPKVQLQFACNEEGNSYIGLGKGVSVPTPHQAIYAFPEFTASKLFLFTDNYATGYDVMPVLYISAESIEYVFLNYSTQGIDIGAIAAMFPPNNTVIVDVADFPNYKSTTAETIIVSVDNSNINLPDDVPYSSAYLVNIAPDQLTPDTGTVSFYHYNSIGIIPAHEVGVDIEVAYYSNAMLKGAIVSADQTSYECTSKKLLARQKILAGLALNRSLGLQASEMADDCKLAYSEIINVLPQLNNNTFLVQNNMTAISKASTTLRLKNEDLLRGNRCPLLY
jgi:hypothetical protein